MSFLSGRKILIVGGNGFVGNRVASKLVRHAAQVSVLSRHGPRFQYPQNKKINWVIGSAMDAQNFKNTINQADTVIHSLGALFDTSITKMRSPGEPGTYEQMNRDTFLRLLQALNQKKKVIYISSVNPPPFLHRYLTTKLESQQALFKTDHEGYSIRPGFIYDWQLKKWSLGLRYAIKAWNKVYPPIYSIARNGTFLQKFLKQFQQSQPTSLEKLANAITYISYKGYQKKIIHDKDLLQISDKYQKLIRQKQNIPSSSQKQKEGQDKGQKNQKL